MSQQYLNCFLHQPSAPIICLICPKSAMSAAFSDWRRDTYAHNTSAVWQEEVGLLEAVSSEEMLQEMLENPEY